jgi:hypothetical protein
MFVPGIQIVSNRNMRITVITTVPSAVWDRPTAATAPVRGILTTAPQRPAPPRPAPPRPAPPRPAPLRQTGPRIKDTEHYQLESRRAMLQCIARLLTGSNGEGKIHPERPST